MQGRGVQWRGVQGRGVQESGEHGERYGGGGEQGECMCTYMYYICTHMSRHKDYQVYTCITIATCRLWAMFQTAKHQVLNT